MLFQYALVFLQFGGIIFFFLTGSLVSESFLSMALIVISVINGVWALLSMNLKTLTALPELRKQASLVTTGPYRFVRHPMYTSVILLLSGMMINEYSLFRLLVLIVIIIVLNLKIKIEEKQLKIRFPEYTDYILKTKKLLPFIY